MPEIKQATINLPAGMDATKVKAILASYEKKSKTQGAKNGAKRDAVKKLIDAHKPEYEGYLKTAKTTRGIS